MAGEASALYLYSEEAAGKIRAFRPDAKIVIMLRQPADFLFSLHGQLSYDMHCEDLTDFRAALDAEPDRRRGRRLPRDLAWKPRLLFYRECATFSTQVRRYLDAFGRDRVHFILFDDFTRDPQAEFSGSAVSWTIRDDVPIQPRSPTPRGTGGASGSPTSSSGCPAAAGRRPPRPPPDPPPGPRRAPPLQRGPRLRKPLDPALRRALTAEFTPEIRALGELIGRDLSAWCAD